MKTSPLHLPGQDPQVVEATRVHQEALGKLLQSLDARKNRMFDPTLLAFAQAMLTPGQTGSFGEALGRAAGAVGASEAQMAKEEQELAKMRLDLAQMGLGIESQRARERAYLSAIGKPETPLGMQPPAAPGAPAGAPMGAAGPGVAPSAPAQAPAAPGQPARTFPVPGPKTEAPPGFQGIAGIPFMPPDPRFVGREDYLRRAMLDNIPLAQATAKAEELERQRYETKEAGIVDRQTGLLYPFPKGELVERQIGGSTYKIPGTSAALLDLYQANNDPRYRALADQITKGGVGGAMKSETERIIERTEEETLAKGRAEAAAKKEAESDSLARAARTMLFNANRTQQYVSQSPQAFGIFARPGMMSAIGNLINEGIRAGTTSVQLGGFENTIRQMMPGITQKDLDNVMMAAGSLAETELAYTTLYMRGGGSITEGERAIVRQIPGNISQSPGVLMQKAKLVQLRSQHDLNVYDSWRSFQKENPRSNYNTFERSDVYQNLLRQYDDTLSKAFNVAPPKRAVSPRDMVVRPVSQ